MNDLVIHWIHRDSPRIKEIVCIAEWKSLDDLNSMYLFSESEIIIIVIQPMTDKCYLVSSKSSKFWMLILENV